MILCISVLSVVSVLFPFPSLILLIWFFPLFFLMSLAAATKSLQSCPTVRPHRRQPTRLPCPWDSPGKNTGVGCHFLLQCMKVKNESEVTQSFPTLSDPMDCSLPGSSIPGIFQARVLEWVAISFSRGSSWPRDRTWVSRIVGGCFILWATCPLHTSYQ